jgi:hypothetical protein
MLKEMIALGRVVLQCGVEEIGDALILLWGHRGARRCFPLP